jgi:hypothetical protein
VAARSSLNLQFHRPECRLEFDKARSALRVSLREGGLEDAASRLLELGAALDIGVARLKPDLLGSALSWNEDNRLVIAWIYQQHRKIIEMGAGVIEAMRRDRPGAALLARIVALSLFHWGEAIKWVAGRERRDYTPLHDMLKLSMAGGTHREALNWVADGRGRRVSIESLYLRALLLDRFASGNLSRQQVEVLDAWLWEWAACLKADEAYPGSASLRVNLDENAGLRDGRRERGRSVYLPLDPLESRRRQIIKELHCGRIFPAYGCTAHFRIEEHVAVIDHLARAFRPREDSYPERAARRQESARIEMWVGFPEILARATGVTVGTDTGKWRALSLTDPAISTDPKDAGRPVPYGNADLSRRCLWLSDTSDGGCGFEALEIDAAGIEVADVVGWRRASRDPITLGRVVRRQASATLGQVFLGVQLLTETGLPITLVRTDAPGDGSVDTFLFVPGDDASGRRDAFLLPEATFQQQHSYRARTGDESYTIKFSLVRSSGRGWILAGFEVVHDKGVETLGSSEDSPTFDLVFDDPWSDEVRPRLQS